MQIQINTNELSQRALRSNIIRLLVTEFLHHRGTCNCYVGVISFSITQLLCILSRISGYCRLNRYVLQLLSRLILSYADVSLFFLNDKFFIYFAYTSRVTCPSDIETYMIALNFRFRHLAICSFSLGDL